MITNSEKKNKKQSNKAIIHKIEEGFIPFVCHYDQNTILTKNGELMQTIRITGFAADSVAVEILSLREALRDSISAHIKDIGFAFWFHTFRRKKNISPKGEFSDAFAKKVDAAWDSNSKWSSSYVNELYITIITEGLDTSISNFSSFISSFSSSATQKKHSDFLKNSSQKLKKAVTEILVDIEEYGAKLLGIKEYEGVLYSEQMRFLGKITNLREERYPLWFNDISHDLASHKIIFGGNMLEVIGKDNKNFAAILSIKEYQEFSVQTIDRIMQLPFEFIISQSFDFNFDIKELEPFQYQDYILKVSGDEDSRHLSGIASLVEANTNSQTDYGKLQTTLMIISDNKDDLQKDIKSAIEKLSSLGIVAVREDVFLEHCFWSQLPANFSFLRRQKIINATKIAGFASLTNFPKGNLSGNYWKSCVATLKTVLDSPYFFNFHKNDLAHSFIFGPKESGKTVLINFLITQAQKFNPRIFYFDSNQSSEAFIKVINGSYYNFDKNHENFLKINPLLLEESLENKEFLKNFILSLIFNSKDRQELDQSILDKIVDEIYFKKVNNLSDLIALFNHKESYNYYSKLNFWLEKNLSYLFGSESEIDFNQKIIGFDLSAIIDKQTIIVPIFNYLIHRIEKSLDGNPTIIVLDEAWKLIDNEIINVKISEILLRLKEKNCLVIFSSSDINAINETDLIFELKRNIATEIYTANSEANEIYQSIFELSDQEVDLIKIMQDDQHHFIFKNDDKPVIATVDLKNLSEILKILSANEITRAAIDEIISINKDDSGKTLNSEIWLDQLFEILEAIKREEEEERRRSLIEIAREERMRKERLESEE